MPVIQTMLILSSYFMPVTHIKLAILDNYTLFIKTLKSYLSERKNITVAIQSSNEYDLLQQLKHTQIDALLVDILMPALTDTIILIRQEYPRVKILLLGTDQDIHIMCDLLELGIYGFISKSGDPEDLLQAIDAVKENRVYRNRLFTDVLYENTQHENSRNKAKKEAALNDREKKILQLLWDEKSNKDIAAQLFVSIRTVEKTRQDLKDKLGVRSTVGILKYAIKNKIILPSYEG